MARPISVRTLLGVATLVLTAGAAPTRAVTVTILGSQGTLAASDGLNNDDVVQGHTPANGAAFSVSDGASVSAGSYVIGNTGLTHLVQQIRAPQGDATGPHTFAKSDGSIRFTVDQQTTYQLSGAYTLSGEGRVFFIVGFAEFQTVDGQRTEIPGRFKNVQETLDTTNESFVVGESGGDFGNQLEGVLSGTLRSASDGYDYVFSYTLDMTSSSGIVGQGASAVGTVSLAIGGSGSTEPIPEPTTVGLVLAGAVLTAVGRRRRAA